MKSTFTKILAILFICNALAYAQKENNNWYFGKKAGITFNTSDGEPVALDNSQMNTLEGTAVASDKDGNLLFYTDGSKVWTKDHTIMKNGYSLKGSRTSSQSALIIPNPSNDSIYYIFTTDHSGNLNEPEFSSGIN